MTGRIKKERIANSEFKPAHQEERLNETEREKIERED